MNNTFKIHKKKDKISIKDKIEIQKDKIQIQKDKIEIQKDKIEIQKDEIEIKNENKAKSRKVKNFNIDKKELWNTIDLEFKNDNDTNLQIEFMGNSQCQENCEHCGSHLAYSEEGFLVCTNNKCAIIYKNVLDYSAEWRYYGADDHNNSDPTRCGMPINPLLEDSSYGCKILYDGHMTYEMRKIRRYTEWNAMPYKEHTQYDEFQKITTMANNGGISKLIIDDAILYYKKISDYESSSFRGANRNGIIAASIYISCHINDYPRTSDEIAKIFNLDKKDARKGCKLAVSIINDLEKDMNNKDKTNLGKTKPEAFIERYCTNLNINNELTKLCKFISMKIENKNIMPENTPPSIAAGVVYFIVQLFNLNISKTEIRNVSEISEVTINKCCKKLEIISKEDPLVPNIILKKYNISNDD